jgi:hypothetical protein
MSRVPEKMSFTHAEGIRWLADLAERDRRPLTLGSAAQVRPEVTVTPSDRA